MSRTTRHLNGGMHAPATESESAPAAGEPSYEPPVVTWLGTVAQLTRGATGSYGDMAGFQDAGGSGGI